MSLLSRGVAAAVIAGCVASAGCTLLGAGIGASASPPEPEKRFLRSELDRVPVGSEVAVTTYSSGTLRGRFEGAWKNADGSLDFGSIGLEQHSRRTRIDVSDIHSIEAHGTTGGVWMGAGIGFVADVAVLSLLATAKRDEPRRTQPDDQSGGIGSCPLIFSLDGEIRHLDAEVFVAAVFPGLDRTDLARLDHATERGGRVQLEITGQPGETQHLDAVRVLAVDHPIGTEVVPTPAGELRLVRKLVSPRRARGFGNADLTAKLAGVDGEAWVSTPLGRDPHAPGDLRDWIELEFARPGAAREGTLLLHVRNTLWAAHLEREMLAVEPRAVEPLYAAVRSSTTARRMVQLAMERELGLHVAIEQGGEWRLAGHVWPVGPAAPRALALPVDLSRISGDVVRLRVESSPGLWSIDRAAMSFGRAKVARAVALETESIADSTGSDRSDELRAADGRYFDMPGLERARLEVRAPETPPKGRRSTFVEATGWYSVHPNENRRARADLLGMVAEPGAFARFSIADVRHHDAGASR